MKCPGQDTKYWKPDAVFEIKCPQCSQLVEFFKDDTSRKCGQCGHRFVNPKMDFGCAAYCPFAEQCMGTLPDEVKINCNDLLKDRVAVEMKRYFGRDFKRIGHATRVARYAERISRQVGANIAVVLVASYLHDIGIPVSEEKYNSAAAKYQEIEGPSVAQEILIKLKANPDLIDEVCDIIGHHHHPREEESINFKTLYDADLIANIEDRGAITKEGLENLQKSFLTSEGYSTAREVLLKH